MLLRRALLPATLLLAAALAWLLADGAAAPPPAAPSEPAGDAPLLPAVAAPAPAAPSAGGRALAAAPLPRLLSGRVQDRWQRPLAAVTVLLRGGARPFEARTDAAGAFGLADVEPGVYQVLAMGPQLLTHCQFVDVAAAPHAPLLLTVDTGVEYSGTVADAQQRPVPRARVTPWRRVVDADELDRRCSVGTDWRGGFQLRGAATGCTVLVEADGFTAAKLRLLPGRPAAVQLETGKQ